MEPSHSSNFYAPSPGHSSQGFIFLHNSLEAVFFFPLASSCCCLIISIISFSLYLSLRFSCSSVRASRTPSPQPPNSCGTNRPEAEG